MDIGAEIAISRDSPNIKRVAKIIANQPDYFDQLIELVPTTEFFQQRASQTMIYCLEYEKVRLTEVQKLGVIDLLLHAKIIEGGYRNLLKVIDLMDIYPEEKSSELFDYCMNAITDFKRAVAIRAFAIPIVFKIATNYPELLTELKLTLEAIPPEDGVSVQSRRRKYLKKIERILSR